MKIFMSQLLGSRTLDQLFPIRNEKLKMFLKLISKKAEAKEAFDVNGVQKVANNTFLH